MSTESCRGTLAKGMRETNQLSAEEWSAFVERTYADIYRFLLHLSNNEADAADLTQRTFLRAWERRSSCHWGVERAWVYAIARNIFLDDRRWWKRFTRFTSGMPRAEAVTPQMELTSTIQHAVAHLPARQREVFILRHWHGFSTAEVASLLRLHEGTVKVHLKRAVDSVKRNLICDEEATSTAVRVEPSS